MNMSINEICTMNCNMNMQNRHEHVGHMNVMLINSKASKAYQKVNIVNLKSIFKD